MIQSDNEQLFEFKELVRRLKGPKISDDRNRCTILALASIFSKQCIVRCIEWIKNAQFTKYINQNNPNEVVYMIQQLPPENFAVLINKSLDYCSCLAILHLVKNNEKLGICEHILALEIL